MGSTKATISLRLSIRVRKMAPQLIANAMRNPIIQLIFNCLTNKVTVMMLAKKSKMWSQ